MEEIVKFLEANKYGSLATCENGQPHVRPFEFGFKTEEGVFFYTSKDKEVYKQLSANPKASFCATDPDLTYVQLIGEVKFTEDQKHKEMILQKSDNASNIYGSADNSELIVFCMNGKAIMHQYESGYSCNETF